MSNKNNNSSQVDPTVPLSELVKQLFGFDALNYPEVTIELDIHASDHGFAMFQFNNSFQETSLSIVEQIARTQMAVGHLTTVIRREHLLHGDVLLVLGVSFSGVIIGDLTDQIQKYLDDLAQKVTAQSSGTQITPPTEIN